MDTFEFVPSWTSQVDIEPKVSLAQFGDGYEQATPKGINSVVEVWSLQFQDIKDAEYYQIKSFLKSKKGSEAFLWTTPDGDTFTFRCRSWNGSPPSFGVRNMSMKFEQVFV